MNYVDKTLTELIEELEAVKKEHKELRALYENDISNLKNAEESLKLSEQRLREVLENSVDAAYKRDLLSNHYEYISPVFTHLTGYTPEEMKTLPLETVIGLMHPDDVPEIQRTLSEATSNGIGKANQVEYRFKHKDGSYRWFIDRFTLVSDGQNGPVALIGSISDITERKQAEQALRHSEEKHRTILQTTMDGFCLTDSEGQILEVNEAYVQMSGYSVEELMTMKISDMEAVESEEETIHHIQEISSHGEDRFETRHRRKNGIIYDVEVSVQHKPIEGGLFVSFLRDVTQRKKINDELAKAKEELEKFFSLAPDMFAIASAEGYFINLNPEWEKTLGYTIQELLSEPFESFIHPDDVAPTREEVSRQMRGRKTLRFENRYRHKDGSYIWLEWNATPAMGNVLYAAARNVTANKIAEKKLLESESNLNAVVNITDESIFLLSADETVITVNEIGAKRLGRTPEQTIGCRMVDLFPPEIEASRRPFLNRALLNGEKVTVEDERNGRWMISNLYPILDNDGQVVRLAVYSRDITERKMAVKALAESEQKYRLLLEGSILGVLAFDVETLRCAFANYAACKLFGYNEEEIIGLQLSDFHPKDSFESVINEFELQGRGEKSISNALPCLRKNGTVFYADIAGYATTLNGRNCSIGFILDVTERKQIEEALTETRHFLDSIIEQSPNSMWISDKHGTMIRLNQACRDNLKLRDEEVVGKYNLFDDNLVQDQGFMPMVRDVFEKGITARFMIHYDTSIVKNLNLKQTTDVYLDVSISPILDEDGNVTNAIVQHSDITELKRTDKALRESETLYRAILNESPDDVTITDLNGKVLMVSDAALPMFGFASKEDIKGRYLLEFVAPQDHELAISNLEGMSKGSKQTPTEYLGLRSDGSTFNVEVNGKFVRDDAGNPIYMIFVVRDITQRKRTELDLVEAKEKAQESDRLKTAFLENMSHEIRTPMNGIIGFSNLLKEQNLSHEEQLEYIEIIEKSGNRLLNVINDIVDIAKIESGQMEVIVKEENLNEKTQYVFNFFKPQTELKGIKLFVENGLPNHEATIETDHDKVVAVLVNLVSNAIKYTHRGFIKFGYRKAGDHLEFFVSDSGEGIRKDQQGIIFERFRQGDRLTSKNTEGTGLGLSISKAYVEMLGGKIRVESEVGAGSTFYFTLPVNSYRMEETTLKQSPEMVQPEQPGKKAKILLAEDDENSVFLMQEFFRKREAELVTATTGVEVVELCRNNPDIDLILMDIRMPVMDGYEATRQIREFNNEVIIIAQTSYALAGDRENAINAGCNDHITKPIVGEKLNRILNKYLNPNQDHF